MSIKTERALGHCRKFLVSAILGLGLLFAFSYAQAFTTMYSQTADAKDFFEFEFADKGEFFPSDPKKVSPWTLSPAQKRDVARAGQLWAEVLSPGAKNNEAVYFTVVTTNDEDNAHCGSGASDDDVYMFTVQKHIIDGISSQEEGFMDIGILKGARNGLPYSVLPNNNDFMGTIYHEIAHALGVLTDVSFEKRSKDLSVFGSHLVDKYGTKLQPGMKVTPLDPGKAGTGVFYVGKETRSGVNFHGAHVQEVMGNDDGIRIQGSETNSETKAITPDLSHIELEHSLMSHQSYRNYNTFMEAELAILQDIGYKIDRKNFYGKTIFGNGQTLINTDGYFARNAQGTAYLEGQANTATLGVGLHIYGKNNDVTQAKDLLAGGEAAVGIRIDGSDNMLRLPQGINVAADGENGTALLVAYGKNHQIVSQGNLVARGAGGIGARFDFGHNLCGDHSEYRGSWILTKDGENSRISIWDDAGFRYNLNGPLVKQFDVSADLMGEKAAIYISDNAFVQNINILKGANVQGDIVSEWDPEDELVQYRGAKSDMHTSLTFGYQANSDGTASSAVADDFDMELDGSISGSESIDMKVVGGRLDVTGTVDVYSLENRGYLSLQGLNRQGQTATVANTFVNDANATLETGFWSDGTLATVKTQNARVAGTWALRPEKSFYPNNKAITLKASPFSGRVSGRFSAFALGANQSPTLQFSVVSTATDSTATATTSGLLANSAAASEAVGALAAIPANNGQPVVTVTRASDAYSRFADNAGASGAGKALADIADDARGDMQNLLTELDWSLDGRGIGQALNQLGPEAYDAAARTSLRQQNDFNVVLLNRMLAHVPSAVGSSNGAASNGQSLASGRWTAWGSFLGSTSSQQNHGSTAGWNSQGINFLGGADLTYDTGLTVGLHLGFSSRRIRIDGDHDAKSWINAAFLGGQALYAPHNWDGAYVTGLARIGLEDSVMTRHVAFGDYARHNESRWTAPAGSLLLGAGKDFSFALGQGVFKAGPLLWLEYACMHRPEISESDGKATRLHLDATNYQSLQSALGARLGYQSDIANGTTLSLHGLAAWRHEILDGAMRTEASFRSYGGHSFESESDLVGRDALLLQGSLELKHKSGFFAQVSVGGETLRTASSSLTGGVSFGLEF